MDDGKENFPVIDWQLEWIEERGKNAVRPYIKFSTQLGNIAIGAKWGQLGNGERHGWHFEDDLGRIYPVMWDGYVPYGRNCRVEVGKQNLDSFRRRIENL